MSDLGWFAAGWAGLSLAVWALPAAAEALLKHRLGPGVRRALWLFVMLRAAVPFGLVALAPVVLPGIPAGLVSPAPAGGSAAGSSAPLVRDPGGIPEVLLWAGLWALGAAGLVVSGLPARRRWSAARKTSLPLTADLVPLAAAEAPGLRVRRIAGLRSPCLAGLFRPTVYLPAAGPISRNDLKWMLRHEAAHARRGDLGLLAFARGLTLVFWFLPGLWLALGRLAAALEAGCDARALQGAEADDRRAYGEALLRLLEAPGARLVPSLAMASTLNGLKQRLGAIRRPNRTTSAGLALVLAALAAGGLWGLPAGEPPRSGWPFAAGTRAWVTLGYGPVAPELNLPITDHPGIDLAARSGTPVLAPWSGTVKAVGANSDDGNLVVLDLGSGWTARLTHLKAPAAVAVGDRVGAGQPVGLLGSTGVSTGPHVHVEVLRDGVPTDPAPFLSP